MPRTYRTPFKNRKCTYVDCGRRQGLSIQHAPRMPLMQQRKVCGVRNLSRFIKV